MGKYIIDLFGGNKIISKLSDVITFIAKSFRYLVNMITKKELKDGLAKNLGEAFDYIKEQYAKFKNYIGTEDFKNKVETIKNYIVSAIETVKKTVNIAWNTVVNVYDWLVEHFGTEATMQGLIVTYLLGPGNIMSVLSGVTTAFSGLLTMVLNIGTALSKLAFSNSFMLAISSITMAFGIWSDFFMHPDDFMKKVTAFTTVLSSWLDEFLTKLKYGVLDAMGESWSKESVEKTFNKNGFKAGWDKTKSGYENYTENEKNYYEYLKTYEGIDYTKINDNFKNNLRKYATEKAINDWLNKYQSFGEKILGMSFSPNANDVLIKNSISSNKIKERTAYKNLKLMVLHKDKFGLNSLGDLDLNNLSNIIEIDKKYIDEIKQNKANIIKNIYEPISRFGFAVSEKTKVSDERIKDAFEGKSTGLYHHDINGLNVRLHHRPFDRPDAVWRKVPGY